MSYFSAIVLTIGITFSATSAALSTQKTVRVEVFTVTGLEVLWKHATGINKTDQSIDVQVYQLNQIQLVETALSNNLPANPKQSKQFVLQRFQQLDKQSITAFQHTAVGLAKAMQYGIDRYPAIVFGGEVVVYGLTDLSAATDHYQTWQEKNRP